MDALIDTIGSSTAKSFIHTYCFRFIASLEQQAVQKLEDIEKFNIFQLPSLSINCGFHLSMIQTHQLISPAAQSNLRSVFQCVQTVPGFHPADERCAVLCRIHQINTRLIYRHRIIGG